MSANAPSTTPATCRAPDSWRCATSLPEPAGRAPPQRCGSRCSLPEELRQRLEALGIADDSRIVVYFGKDWVSPATRLLFTLDYAGLGANAALLDGGQPAWVRDGRAVTAEAVAPPAGRLAPLRLRDVDRRREVRPRAPRLPRASPLVDARDSDYYSGVETGGSPEHPHRTGHIAGARSVPFDSTTTDDLHLRPEKELRRALRRRRGGARRHDHRLLPHRPAGDRGALRGAHPRPRGAALRRLVRGVVAATGRGVSGGEAGPARRRPRRSRRPDPTAACYPPPPCTGQSWSPASSVAVLCGRALGAPAAGAAHVGLFADGFESGNTLAWSASAGEPALLPAEVFRLSDLDLRDPHLYVNPGFGCFDFTDQDLPLTTGTAFNGQLQAAITGDSEPDGLLDSSFLLEFRPFDEAAAALRLDIGGGLCTAPMAGTSCAPDPASLPQTAGLRRPGCRQLPRGARRDDLRPVHAGDRERRRSLLRLGAAAGGLRSQRCSCCRSPTCSSPATGRRRR